MGGIARALREVEPRNGKAGIVTAIEVEWDAARHDSHADHRMGVRAIEVAGALEGSGHLGSRGRHHHALAIALSPIEVPAEIHGT